ncbi:hypothetical protein C0J52_08773 [Blattella germanica]|nr:hypothetical protein C0J52_08773 [Blattella germanica]
MSQSNNNSEGKGGQEKKVTTDTASENENVASRTSKVDLGLIETILDEMKSEFNREVNIGENVSKDKSDESKDITEKQSIAVKNELLKPAEEDGNKKNNNSKVDDKSERNNASESSDKTEKPIEKEDGESGVSVETSKQEEKQMKLESDDSKSRISLNSTKTSDELTDENKKIKLKNVQEKESNSSDTLSSVKESEINVSVASSSSSLVITPLSSGKRSLRSKAAAAKAQAEEPAGVKRSARRRSKDSPRESVLQSAIARKEKSFSTLSQIDDKSSSARNMKILSHRSPRSPRHSPVDKNQVSRTSKSPARLPPPPPKSPRLAQQVAEQANSKSNRTEENTSANVDLTSNTSLTEGQSERSVTQKSMRSVVKSVHTSNTQAYTKTGKRRYRPYKGLRYSFTGNNVRRTKPPRRHVKDVLRSSSIETKKPEDPEEKAEVEVNPQQEGEEEPNPTPVVEVVVLLLLKLVKLHHRKENFNQRKMTMLKLKVVFADDGNKRARLSNVPSPSPADSSQRPAKPESTAISSGAGTAGLCCCQTKSQLYVSSRGQNGIAAEIYCQAMDTLDDRLVGCCNAVTTQDTCLSRPSRRVPFLILCDVHMQRLLRHNCCPVCGIFCTQGKFVQCASLHWYHRDCQLTVASSSVCPHCGLDSPANDVILSMRSGKNPVFLPQQKPPKKVPSAKMSFGVSKMSGAKTDEVILREPTPPLVPPVQLPSQVSTATLDKDKLAKLLSVACSMHKSTIPSPRSVLVFVCFCRFTYLLQNRADPLIRDAEQNIALHWSAYSGSVDISEMLLNHGCDVNSTNVLGDTPLHIGARQNMYNCVLLLLARGARVDISNNAGDSPLDCCTVENNECYVAINLNIQLKANIINPRQRTQRILTNDISRGQEQNPIQCVNIVDDEGEPTDFVYVSENCFTSNISLERTITSLQSCKCTDICTTVNCHCGNISLRCWYDEQGRLVPEFNYADPPMLFECNQACACNRITCHNRVVQHGLTSRFELFRTKDKGWGVRTLRPISRGTYVCEKLILMKVIIFTCRYIGEIISDCEADHREDDSYLFDLDNRDGETYCIDARHYGNVARFINHMCVPNLLPVRVFIEHQDLHFPRIAFFANRDIEADEELGWVKTSKRSHK